MPLAWPRSIAVPARAAGMAARVCRLMRKAVATAEWKSKMVELGFTTLTPDPVEYDAAWKEWEAQMKEMMRLKREAAR